MFQLICSHAHLQSEQRLEWTEAHMDYQAIFELHLERELAR